MHTEDRYTIDILDLTETDTVNTGTHDYTNIRPDKGFVYEIIGFYFSAPDPAGSGSGDHSLSIDYTDGTTNLNVGSATSNFGSAVYMRNTGWVATTEAPPNAQEQIIIHTRGILCSTYDNYIQLDYYNNTDVNQAGNRTINVVVKKYREANF